MTKYHLLAGALLGTCIAMGATTASAQYRLPLPGGYRMAPQAILPMMRGASQLGWGIGRYQSVQRYGRMGDPGPWPGMAPALGIRRR
jgi:uncharacterized membrane protein AbrB (regulator of aidB expression)